MNDVQAFIDRQLGIYNRMTYDSVLHRLMVQPDDSFYGLQNSMADASLEQDPPIFACRFAEAPGYDHILALANEDGRVAIQDTRHVHKNTVLESSQCHNNAVFDLAWRPGHMSFVTVSGDHTASLWDLEEGSPRRVSVFASHSRSVKCAVFRPGGGAVFASGARDGSILLWDCRAPPAPALAPAPAPARLVSKPDSCLANCHSSFTPKTPSSASKRARVEPTRASSITGLVFQDDVTLISCGECDGNVKVWDLRKHYSLQRREPLPLRAIPYAGSSSRRGYTHLTLDRARCRLYASCVDHAVYCYNVSAYSALPERRYVGHENGTFYIKTSLSPDGRYLVSGSSDKYAYIWNVTRSEPLVRLAGHRAEVTCAAWGRAGAGAGAGAGGDIVTCSDDASHKIWRVGEELVSRERELELRGRAERAPHADPARLAAAASTPRGVKRARSLTPAAAERERRTQGRQSKTKRCLADMLGAAAAGGGGGEEGAAKRHKCALSPVPERQSRLLSAGSKRRAEEAQTTPPKRACPVADWSYESPQPGTSFMTPSKCYERRVCRKISPSLRSPPGSGEAGAGEGGAYTPTKNLPNFVLTGEAPHLRLMSPIKKKPETTDWLTALRRSRAPPAAGPPAPAPAPPAAPAPAPLSPRENLPPRRTSTTDKTPKATVKTRTLLKYFNIASREK